MPKYNDPPTSREMTDWEGDSIHPDCTCECDGPVCKNAVTMVRELAKVLEHYRYLEESYHKDGHSLSAEGVNARANSVEWILVDVEWINTGEQK